MNPVIGIIGGMGPMATCDLMEKIIRATDASCDQEHVRICVDNNTVIPDRTKALLHGGKDPVPEIVKSGQRLEQMGAQVLIMGCNTAHCFYDQIVPHLQVPLLNMIEETAKYLSKNGVKRAGILATDGTCQSHVYDRAFAKAGLEAVYPSPENQKIVMRLIYDYVKAGNEHIEELPIQNIVDEMRQLGAEKMVLGCTELPLAFAKLGLSQMTVDPTQVLAHSALAAVGAKELPF